MKQCAITGAKSLGVSERGNRAHYKVKPFLTAYKAPVCEPVSLIARVPLSWSWERLGVGLLWPNPCSPLQPHREPPLHLPSWRSPLVLRSLA